MKTCIFILLSLLLNVPQLFAQWHMEYPDATRNNYYFNGTIPQSTKLYALGEDLLIFDTSTKTYTINEDYDPGISLRNNLTSFPSPNTHSNIHFTSSEVGFMVHRHQILKTQNGGSDWYEVEILSPNTTYATSAYFTDIHFPNPSVGYAVGTADKIFKTTDGGENWTPLQWSTSTAPYRRMSEVFFKNENEGYVFGFEVANITLNIGQYKNFMLKTVDGGQSWEETPLLTGNGISDHHYVNFQMVDDTHFYASLINRNYVFPLDLLVKSNDGGQSWTVVNLPDTYLIRDMHWFNPQEGVLLASSEGFGQERTLLRTTDGGNNWTTIILPIWTMATFGQTAPLAMTFTGDFGLLTGAGGGILYSEDRGQNWTVVRAPMPHLSAIQMVDSDEGMAVGEAGLIMRKQAGDWSLVTPPLNVFGVADDYKKIVHNTDSEYAIQSISNSVYITTDQGASWETVIATQDTLALDLAYENGRLRILAKVDTELLLFDYDAQNNTFNSQLIENVPSGGFPPGALSYFEDDLIYVNFNEQLYRSADGGQSWVILYLPPSVQNGNVYLANDTLGFVSSGEEVWKTTDGGTTWNENNLTDALLPDDYFQINGFHLMQDTILFAFVQIYPSEDFGLAQDVYLRSNDQGQSWEAQFLPFHQESFILRGIRGWTSTTNQLYLTMSNGVIFRYDEPIVTSTPEVPNIDQSYRIYPNPVYEQFRIEHPFDVADLRIYDINGREVWSSQNVPSGQWISPELPAAGTYCVNITNGTSSKTVKILAAPTTN